MAPTRYDALVVGAGPAGSVAALVLARGGARVALVDKAAFPRDKACGDLVGPRGVQLLTELGCLPAGRRLGDMEVVGPSGHRVLLPARQGLTYPGHGLAVTRLQLDDALRAAAIAAGAEAFCGRAGTELLAGDGSVEGFVVRDGAPPGGSLSGTSSSGGSLSGTTSSGTTSSGTTSSGGSLSGGSVSGAGGASSSRGGVSSSAGEVELRAEVVIGADGALSRVGAAAGLVDESRALWGFAVRGYARPAQLAALREAQRAWPPAAGAKRPDPDAPAAALPLPRIVFWEPERWAGYPGYGWVFPGPGGDANVGVGIGVRGDRRAGARAARDLDAFRAAAGVDGPLERRLGGWLKMGMAGTVPAAGRVLLAGDAAGLVNPLQGEGIAQAMISGRAAAEAVLAGPPAAAGRYRAELAERFAPFAGATAAVTAWMLRRPRAVAGLGRLLTAPGLGRLWADGWAVYWNDLLDGAAPGRGARQARVADAGLRAATRRAGDTRAVRAAVEASGADRTNR